MAFLNRLLLVLFSTDFQSRQISDEFIKRQIQKCQIHGNSFVWSAMVDQLKKGVYVMLDRNSTHFLKSTFYTVKRGI